MKFIVISLALLLAACGGTGSRSAVQSAVDINGAQSVSDIGTDHPDEQTPADASPATEVSADTSMTCPGKPGCTCKDNTDCDGGFCIDTGEGTEVCATPCVSNCATNEKCAQVSSPGGDIVSICVKQMPHLCDPCTKSNDCLSLGVVDAACVNQGAEGSFCGSACTDGSACPVGYACSNVATAEGMKSMQCVRSVGATCPCSLGAIKLKASTSCYLEAKDASGQVTGKCAGLRSCGAAGLTACLAAAPTTEVCDGQDNDCNGVTDEGTCDDANSCTVDSCKGSKGCDHAPQDGKPCDADGSVCTENDQCVAGACASGPSKNCNDSNPCTSDACDPAKGCTHSADDGIGCDDDNPCTVGDTCADSGCNPGKPKECMVNQPCTSATCDLTSGKCVFASMDDGLPCDDGSSCSTKDLCTTGKCAGTVISCDDVNPCTNDGCDPKTGCTHSANLTACDDGDLCTTGDVCSSGACLGTPKAATACDDGNVCTADACQPTTGCVHTSKDEQPCDDGNVCTVGDTCSASACAPGTSTCACQSDIDCVVQEDGNLCNGTLFCDKTGLPYKCAVNPKTVILCSDSGDTVCVKNSCDAKSGKCAIAAINNGKDCDADGSVCTADDACANGACIPGATVNCDDSNPCTSDACKPASGCTHVVNENPCDADGNACTVGDTCKDKTCLPGTATICDDDNPCTLDGCNKKTGACTFVGATMDGTACDADGSVCTSGDACLSGTCAAGSLVSCDDGNPCTDDSCLPKTGCIHSGNTATCDADGSVCTASDTCSGSKCNAGKALNCDDGNPCTTDTCDAAKGCKSVANTLMCDDGDACTKDDVCLASACSGKPVDCSDGNTCTDDSCDKGKGCQHVNNITGCDDGNACTLSDLCASGICAPGKAKNCDDNNVCTNDACSGGTCTHTNNTSTCDDGNACTLSDVCSGSGCSGKAVDCSDGNICTDDSCSATNGCAHAANVAACDADGSVCTVADTCSSAICIAGKAINCDDGNVCTDDSCDKLKGCVVVNNTTSCNDGNACTATDGCAVGVCAGVTVTCDDKDPCTVDSCDAGKGCVAAAMAAKADCSIDGKSWCVDGKCVGKQVCGNGLVEGTEECDDGNKWDGDGCNSTCACSLDGVVRCKGGTCTDFGCGANPPNQMVVAPVSVGFAGKPGAAIELIVRQDFTSQYGEIFTTSDSSFQVVYAGDIGYGGNKGKWIGCWAGACIWALNPAQLGVWQHVAVTFDQGTVRFFVNGVLQGQAKGNSVTVPVIPQNVIYFGGIAGSTSDNANAQFNGAIRGIRLSKVTRYTADFAPPVVLGADMDALQLYGLDELAGTTTADSVPPNLKSELKNGASWESGGAVGTCVAFLAKPSCKAWLLSNAALPDGVYPIDPDGAGPIPAANAFCDMKNGGWTLVGNFYDSAGDDMPNATDYVASGWQQTASGKWDAKATTVDRAWGGGIGSAAVSLAFVQALGKAAGQKNLKMCFVHKDGYDTSCRQTSDGSMTLVSYNTGNPKLTAYANDKLTYTFGRLAGLKGSHDDYDYTNFPKNPAQYSVPVLAGSPYEFGYGSESYGLAQHPVEAFSDYWKGVWHGFSSGMSYRPDAVNDNELGAGIDNQAPGALQPNPSANTWGFRLYVGP